MEKLIRREKFDFLKIIRESVSKKRITKTDDSNIKEKSENSNINYDNFLSPVMEQKHVLRNIDLFHKYNEYFMNQCTVCMEAWPSTGIGKNSTASEYKMFEMHL